MIVRLTTNKAKVRDPQKVREILASYTLRRIDIQLHQDDAECALTMAYQSDAWSGYLYPQAYSLARWPNPEEIPDPDGLALDDLDEETQIERYEEACDAEDVLSEDGDAGFRDLLSELGPHLEEPLLIVMVHAWDEDDSGAEAWVVPPGTRQVLRQSVHSRG